jgi:myo-inositol-1(or 4)-monophosphatase
MAQLTTLVTVMSRAAEKAARGLRRDFGEVEQLQVSIKGPSDFVSSADRNAEKILREELQKARPGYGFVLEESGVIPAKDSDQRWIVDPLDGTTNFLHGIPHFAISIALEKAGELVAGIIYNPATSELFWAEKGIGAFLNDRRLRVSGRRKLDEAVIATGIPHRGRPGQDAFEGELSRVMREVAGVRRMGAASLDLAYVAAGRYEGYWETALNSWDVAAGILLVQEAGGFVTEIGGGKDMINGKSILATNGHLHRQINGLVTGKTA